MVIGGSGSGKSAYAEALACSFAEREETKKYYLATMRAYDGEGRKKVKRHRALRSGKGFLTIEQDISVERALMRMEAGRRTVLLECLSNLVANEMFGETDKNAAEAWREPEKIVGKVVRGIGKLREETEHLIVVGNNVFEDGILYDPSTMAYIRAMGEIGGILADMADRVVEVVAGIPMPVKE